MNCQYCDRTLNNKAALKQHQKTAKYCLKIQGKYEDTNYYCTICNKNFDNNSTFLRHKIGCNKPQAKQDITTE